MDIREVVGAIELVSGKAMLDVFVDSKFAPLWLLEDERACVVEADGCTPPRPEPLI
jgi:hypothetical protein